MIISKHIHHQPLLLLLLTITITACGGYKHGGSAHHASGDGHHNDDTVGVPGSSEDVDRTVAVAMNDQMRFVPDSIDVKAGETIRFELTNNGAVKHEMVIGKADYLVEHAKMMMKYPEMEHEEPNMLLLDPSASGELIWTFTQSGKVDFACLQPGHYDAGMKGIVTVIEE